MNNQMTIAFPDEACAATFTWKTYLLLKQQFRNKTWTKGICYGFTSIL